MSIAIEWNVIDYSGSNTLGKWQASSALSSAKLQDGICSYEYSTVMRELLYCPEIYGRLNMSLLSKFKSSYGLALYENCIRYQGLPQTPWFTLDVFRKLMGVFDDKYVAFKDFKKRVLNIAIAEVNKHSPLSILAEIKRRNQKVDVIRFTLSQKAGGKASNALASQKEKVTEDDLIERLTKDFNLASEAIKEILAKYERDYIKEKVAIILKSDSFRLGKIRGLAGYFIEALRMDYKASAKSPRVSAAQLQRKNDLFEETKQEELKRDYNQYVSSVIENYLITLKPDEHEILIKQFVAKLKQDNSIIYAWHVKYGLKHPGVKAMLNNFVKDQLPQVFSNVKSFAEFKQEIALEGEAFAG